MKLHVGFFVDFSIYYLLHCCCRGRLWRWFSIKKSEKKFGRHIASEPTSCPYKDASALLKFRDDTIDYLTQEAITQFQTSIFLPIYKQILLCKKDIESNNLSKEFNNLLSYTKARSNAGSMFDNSDSGYEKYLKSMPRFAYTPLEFYTQLPAEEWNGAIRKAGLPLIIKKEFPTYENSMHRTFTFFEKDNYIQFNLFSDAFLAMITIEKKDRDGKTLAKPIIHFGEYSLNKGSDGKHRLDPKFIGKPSPDRCLNCHASGPRLLVPLPGEVDLDQWQSVDLFNNSIQKLGTFLEYSGNYNPVLVGPSLGSRNNTCTECHDGYIERGILNALAGGAPQGFYQTDFKLLHEWSMPPPPASVKKIVDEVRRLRGLTESEVSEFQKKMYDDDRASRLMSGAKYMKEKGGISAEDFTILSSYMEHAMPRNIEIQKSIYKDYAEDLRNWLKTAR